MSFAFASVDVTLPVPLVLLFVSSFFSSPEFSSSSRLAQNGSGGSSEQVVRVCVRSVTVCVCVCGGVRAFRGVYQKSTDTVLALSDEKLPTKL